MTANPILAICDDKHCQTVFTTGLFRIAGGGSLTLVGNSVAPCPSCGGFGVVPDGIYTKSEAILFSEEQWRFLRGVITRIQGAVEAGVPTDEAIDEALPANNDLAEALKKALAKAQGTWAQFRPQKPGDLAAYLAVVVGLSGQVLKDPGAPVQVETPPEVVELLREIEQHVPFQPEIEPRSRAEKQLRKTDRFEPDESRVRKPIRGGRKLPKRAKERRRRLRQSSERKDEEL